MQSSLLQAGFSRNSWEIEADDRPSWRIAIYFSFLTFQEWSRKSKKKKKPRLLRTLPCDQCPILVHSRIGFLSYVRHGMYQTRTRVVPTTKMTSLSTDTSSNYSHRKTLEFSEIIFPCHTGNIQFLIMVII